jgi:hypothetical protein
VPDVRKGVYGVGVQGGKCVLKSGASEHLYYGLVALKTGFIVGVESHSVILVMNTDEALAKFTKGERESEFGVGASVAVAKLSAGGDLDTTNLKKDIVSFIFAPRGSSPTRPGRALDSKSSTWRSRLRVGDGLGPRGGVVYFDASATAFCLRDS